jgi:hypothetical protein
LNDNQNDSKFITTVSRLEIIQVLKSLEFSVDMEGDEVIILRGSKFPFYRIALPHDEMINTKLIDAIANDLNMPVEYFLPR